MSRKDSKGMFAAVLDQLNDSETESAPHVSSTSPHLLTVAAGVRQMQERSEAAEKLLKTGEQIVELDPDVVRPSSIHDRYDDAYEADAVNELAISIEARGQIVPGLVRPVPNEEGIYQIVYGRRRLAAARNLGIKFKAIVRDLSDEQAVIFQGEENTAREDLSFIEKCVFALAQQEAGFGRETIQASLSTGKSHISEMIAIASEIPVELLHSIGKAPSIGRPRWATFAKKLSTLQDDAWKQVISSADFKKLPSADRFEAVFQIAANKGSAPLAMDNSSWMSSDKQVDISLRANRKRATLTCGAKRGPEFANYISSRLDALYQDFLDSKKTSTGD